jgi:hypothetical protein
VRLRLHARVYMHILRVLVFYSQVLRNVLGLRSVYDKRCDTYSYGVMLWELFHCQVRVQRLVPCTFGFLKHVCDASTLLPKVKGCMEQQVRLGGAHGGN